MFPEKGEKQKAMLEGRSSVSHGLREKYSSRDKRGEDRKKKKKKRRCWRCSYGATFLVSTSKWSAAKVLLSGKQTCWIFSARCCIWVWAITDMSTDWEKSLKTALWKKNLGVHIDKKPGNEPKIWSHSPLVSWAPPKAAWQWAWPGDSNGNV